MRGTTASRLELCGFLILTRLLKVVAAAMNTKPSQVVTVSARNKSGGLWAPYFASIVSEAMANLSELAEEVKMGSIWQSGPAYLELPFPATLGVLSVSNSHTLVHSHKFTFSFEKVLV